MTARPLSRLEPLSNPADPARAIAAFFLVVAIIGTLPALYGLAMIGAGFVVTILDGKPEALWALPVLAYIGLGLAQLRFYFQRTMGTPARDTQGWWLSTYFYNLVPVAISVAVFIGEPHVGPIVTGLWFATLSTLAIVARGCERGRSGLTDRGQSVTR